MVHLFFHLNYTRGSFLNFLSIFWIALKHILEKISFCPLLPIISWFLQDFKRIHLYEKWSKINDESLTFSIKIHNDFGIFSNFDSLTKIRFREIKNRNSWNQNLWNHRISRLQVLKFNFSEKATKVCAIVLMVLTFTYFYFRSKAKFDAKANSEI